MTQVKHYSINVCHKKSFADLLALKSMGCSLSVQFAGIVTTKTLSQEVALYFPGYPGCVFFVYYDMLFIELMNST